MTEISDPFWVKQPSILFKQDRLLEFFVGNDQTTYEKLNSITRFGIYISIVLAMYKKDYKYLYLSLLFIIITYIIYTNINLENIKEYDKNIEGFENEKEFARPTVNNPFGNSSIMDIIDNPTRPPMQEYGEYDKDSLETKQKIEEKFNYNLYRDLGDLYDKKNSQRQFYTTPSRGSIPADPNGDFKKWLYGDMPSCKDNTYDCSKLIHDSPRFKRNELEPEYERLL